MEVVQRRADALVGILRMYDGLVSSHMVEFFTGSLYNLLPENIRSQIEDSKPSEVVDMFWQHGRGEEIGGSSPLGNFLDSLLAVTKGAATRPEKVIPSLRTVGLQSFASQKKGYEVEIMSRVVGSLAEISRASHIVDVGAGKGYLSAHLAIHYNLQVLGIDCSSAKTASSIERTRKMQRAGMDRRKDTKGNDSPSNVVGDILEPRNADLKVNYKQITQMVDQGTCLTSLIEESFPEQSLSGLGLVGLHGCGNLSPCLVQHFASKVAPRMSQGQAFLSIVPCCYHLLESWPTSMYMKQLEFSLPVSAFMHASKILPRIAANKKSGGELLMWWRAVLQVILAELDPEKHFKVGRISKRATSFNDYVKLAFQNLGIHPSMTDAEIDHYYLKYRNFQNQLEIYNLVLSSLATVIESTILIDHLLYLKEQGISESWLVQLFDPVISPRSHALVAFSVT